MKLNKTELHRLALVAAFFLRWVKCNHSYFKKICYVVCLYELTATPTINCNYTYLKTDTRQSVLSADALYCHFNKCKYSGGYQGSHHHNL